MVCVAVLALSALAAVAVPAGAAAAPSAKFCSAYNKISGASGSNGNTPTPKQAGKLAARFKAAAKQAPAKVKSAGNTIVSVLKKIAHISPSNVGDLSKFYRSADFRKYGAAVGTFFTYGATCSSS
jgi:hypothetical protein